MIGESSAYTDQIFSGLVILLRLLQVLASRENFKKAFGHSSSLSLVIHGGEHRWAIEEESAALLADAGEGGGLYSPSDGDLTQRTFPLQRQLSYLPEQCGLLKLALLNPSVALTDTATASMAFWT